MIIAAFVTAVELIMNAFSYQLFLALGFLFLLSPTAPSLGKAYASKNAIGHAAFDGLMMGIGFTIVLVILGVREVLGYGTCSEVLTYYLVRASDFIESHRPRQLFLLAILPPAYIMGFIIAVRIG